jgi:hypothetical protein
MAVTYCFSETLFYSKNCKVMLSWRGGLNYCKWEHAGNMMNYIILSKLP